MPCRPYRKTLSLDLVGYPVPNRTVLRTVLHALTAADLTCFAVESGPENIAIVYVTPQAADRLAAIIRQTAEPSMRQLEAIFRAQARTLFHDEGVLEIDDDAPVSISPEGRGRGAYVQAWAWVDKRAEYLCSTCHAEWFAFELLHTPSAHQAGATPTPSPAGDCPACGAPCQPKAT
jgi:hypothetical protein